MVASDGYCKRQGDGLCIWLIILLLWMPEAPNGFCSPPVKVPISSVTAFHANLQTLLLFPLCMLITQLLFSPSPACKMAPGLWESNGAFPSCLPQLGRKLLQATFCPQLRLGNALCSSWELFVQLLTGARWTALLLRCKKEQNYSTAAAAHSCWRYLKVYFVSATDRIHSRQSSSARRSHFWSSPISEHITPWVWHITALYLICLLHSQWKTPHAALSVAQLSDACQVSLHF